MGQLLCIRVSDSPTNWCTALPHAACVYNITKMPTLYGRSIEHMDRNSHLTLTLFDAPNDIGHQGLDREQLSYCELDTERKEHSYWAVSEHHALIVSRFKRHKAQLPKPGAKLSPFWPAAKGRYITPPPPFAKAHAGKPIRSSSRSSPP